MDNAYVLFGGMVDNYRGLVNKSFFRITEYLTMSTILILASSSITINSEVCFTNLYGLFQPYFHVRYLAYVDLNSYLLNSYLVYPYVDLNSFFVRFVCFVRSESKF